MGCGSHQREGASVRGNISVNGWVKGCQGLKCSGRVSNFGEMQVLYNSSQCFVTLKIWEYAGLVEQCPRFASPDRIHQMLVTERK